MTEYTLTLPYPPTLNHYKKVGRVRRTKKGKLYQPRVYTPESERFIDEVALRFRAQNGVLLKSKHIMMNMIVYPPDRKRRDLDNILKVCLDSLQKAGAFSDDYNIWHMEVIRAAKIIPGGEIWVKLIELD